MSKIIAVYGSPGAGKTTVALKTAMEIYMASKDIRIAFVSPDITVPSVGLLFPNSKPDEVVSLSEVLEKTEVTADNLMKNAVVFKNMKDFVCFGFKSTEKRTSFPDPTDNKINSLFEALRRIAEYVIVDCTDDITDKISRKALRDADIYIRVISPDPKGVCWLKSDIIEERTDGKRFLNVVNENQNDVYLDINEVCTNLKSIGTVLPYCKQVKMQMLNGEMNKPQLPSNFKKALSKLMTGITEGEKENE